MNDSDTRGTSRPAPTMPAASTPVRRASAHYMRRGPPPLWELFAPMVGSSRRSRAIREAMRITARREDSDPAMSDGGLLDVGDGHLNLDTGLNGDGGDLLHDLRGRVKVDEALVDAHLEAIPGVGTLTARRLAGGNAQRLGWQADRALDLKALILSALDQILADLLEVLDVAAGKRDADAVHLGARVLIELLCLHRSHISLSSSHDCKI
mmetsp:Transcript_29068/g.74786  ORF Transcript_29068/g.74786 Transcript_29068/m.74786 type:complete len:209 (-) Transcript_29068:37-663(-)